MGRARRSIHKAGRVEWLSGYRKRENVRPRIMAANIERPAGAPRGLFVDLGVEDTFLPIERPGDNCAHRLDDDRIAVIDPFLRPKELVAFGKVVGYVAALHSGCCADYPAAALLGDVAHGGNPALARVPRGSDIDFDVLRIESIACERHVAFP